MATEDVVIRYRAEVDDLVRQLERIEKAQEDIIDLEKEQSTEAKKSATSAEFAAKKRKQLLESEQKELAQLKKARDLAFDPKRIDEFNKKIRESEKNISLLTKQTTKEVGSVQSALGSFAVGAGAAIAAAFSVDAIIQFGKASVDAFLEAEKNAERLKFAITSIGGESEAQFERLINQSAQLQEITVFSDDSIQQAQAALSAFGLTADEIEKTIPLLADFATVTGTDIAQAAQQLGSGLEGAGREFKKYGIEVSATATRQQNLNNILQGFGKFAGSATEATKTLSGQLEQQKNQVDELQEAIGKRLAPVYVNAKKAVFEFIQTLLLIPADEAREATERQRQELQKQNLDFAIATTQRIQNLDKIAAAQQVLADKENQLEAARSKNINNVALRNKLKEEIELINQIIQAEEQRIRKANEASAAEAARISEEERLKQVEAAKKAAEERLKLLIEQRKVIEEDAKGLTQFESDEQKKRDDAFFDSLEKRNQALKQAADEQAERARQASDIEFANFTQEVAQEDLDTRKAIAKEFERLTLEDLELQKQSIRAKVGFTEDANNQIVIAEQTTKDKIIKFLEAIGLKSEEVSQGRVSDWITNNQEILQTTAQLVGELSSLYATFTNRQIEEINREKEARLASIDQSLKANEDALAQGRISEQDAAANEKKLINDRVRAEEQAAKKEKDLKRKQAIADKAAALVQIAINTAVAISSAIGPQAAVLVPLYTALGAAQAAAVIAQPIPYKKGTKSAKGGLSRVGEEGEEIMYVPKGAKVLPHAKTNRYGEVLDSMFDGRFDEFVNRKYIAPALVKERKRQAESFAINVARSAQINPETGVPALSYYDMEQIRRKGTRLTDDTIDRLADAITRRASNDIYRR